MRAAFFLFVALYLLSDAAFAAERARVVFPPMRPLTADCVLDAARASGMPVAALFAILATEGGKTGEALSNKNGTWDMGPFQVNSVHLNELSAMGISPDAVLRDGRVNAHAAAWLLRKEYRRTGNLCKPSGRITPARRIAGMPTSGASKAIWNGCAGKALSRSPFLSGRQGNEQSG